MFPMPPFSPSRRFSVTFSDPKSTRSPPPWPLRLPSVMRRTDAPGEKICAIPPLLICASNEVALPEFGTPLDQLKKLNQSPTPSIQLVCASRAVPEHSNTTESRAAFHFMRRGQVTFPVISSRLLRLHRTGDFPNGAPFRLPAILEVSFSAGMQKLPLALLIAFTPLLPCAVGAPAPNGRAEHIVVVVWDGMRPDFITPQYCPTLYGLATNGTFFRRHHPVFVSSTEVNGAALATGANPGRNGIQANTDYRLELSFLSSFGTEGLDAVRRGDLLTGGRY